MNAFLDFHTSRFDQRNKISVIINSQEGLFEDLLQSQIGSGHYTSLTIKYKDMFVVVVQIIFSKVRADREDNWSANVMPSSFICSNFQHRSTQLLNQDCFLADKHQAQSIVNGVISTLNKTLE